MGSISFLLARNFDFFYPSGPGGSSHNHNQHTNTVRIHPGTHPSHTNTRGGAVGDDNFDNTNTATPTSVAEDSDSNTDSEQHTAPSDCANHSQCESLGLAGQCCPTNGGMMLACC